MLQTPFHLHLSSQDWTSRDQRMFFDCFKLSIYIITNRVFNTKVFHLDVSKQKNMHETYLKKKLYSIFYVQRVQAVKIHAICNIWIFVLIDHKFFKTTSFLYVQYLNMCLFIQDFGLSNEVVWSRAANCEKYWGWKRCRKF